MWSLFLKNNKFKIILNTRNNSEYIEKSLLSLKTQLYTNFECVVIDDFSDDNSVDIIKNTIGDDFRFKLIFNSYRKYSLENRIIGTNLICNDDEDIIVILDGDDWFMHNRVLEYLNYVYQNEDVWMTYGQHRFATGDHGVSRYFDSSFIRVYNDLWNISHLRSYKYWLFKRIDLNDCKQSDGEYFKSAEDVVVLYPLAEMSGEHLYFLPKITYMYNNLSPYNDYKVNPSEQINVYYELLKRKSYPLIEYKGELKKLSLKLYDEEFKHCKYSGTDINGSEYIEWYRGNESRDYIFYTNRCFSKVDLNESGVKIAWLIEPESILPDSYDYIRCNHTKFDYILTHNKNILDTIPNSFYIPASQTWIHRTDWKIYDKTDMSCFIYSKTAGVNGHNIRETIFTELCSSISKIVGRSVEPFNHKIDILKNFRYSIIAQNSTQDYYFTEHLIDCFLTGAIPIFYGDSSVLGLTKFECKGIYFFKNLEELKNIISVISIDDYNSKYEYIKHNFITAHQYYLQEDYIYNYFLRNILIGRYPGWL